MNCFDATTYHHSDSRKSKTATTRSRNAAGTRPETNEEKEDIPNKPVLPNKYVFVDQAKLLNVDSNDPFRGAYCYWTDAMHVYMWRPDVKKALHVDASNLRRWVGCSAQSYLHYNQTLSDVAPTLVDIFRQLEELNRKLKILIFNGDADMVCDFLGDQWFVDELTSRTALRSTNDRKGMMRMRMRKRRINF